MRRVGIRLAVAVSLAIMIGPIVRLIAEQSEGPRTPQKPPHSGIEYSVEQPAPGILEKKFPFPSPVQWKSGNVEISLIAVAWGPANSPEMIAKGHEEPHTEKPEFFADRSCVLALQFRARLPGIINAEMSSTSGLVRIRNGEGDVEGPVVLTASGFVPFSGSPGIYDLRFKKTDTTEYWDFFPTSPTEKEFLLQAFPYSLMPSAPNATLSFNIILKDNDFVIANAWPEAPTVCPDFGKSFAGTIGPASQVNLQLTRKGSALSGTQEYVRIGTTLWLNGQVDSFGNFVLEEQYPKDQVTGIFKGKFSEGCRTMTGYFSKPDGSRLQPFKFGEIEANQRHLRP